MKQGLLIAIGAVAILLVLSVWVYLLFFGTPQSAQDIFTDFGIGDTPAAERAPMEMVPTDVSQTVNMGSAALRQITTRPVAGFSFTTTGSSTDTVRYSERGTGHVYEIDLVSGVETRVLGKTFAAITNAVFNLKGDMVVLIAEDGYESTAYLEEITDAASSDTHTIPADAENVTFVSDTDLRYTRTTPDGMVGYSYDPDEGLTLQLFTIPFRDAAIIWKTDEALAYNNPAAYLLGGLYRIENGSLARIGDAAYGLTGLAHPQTDTYVQTYVDVEAKELVASHIASDGRTDLVIPAFPEKCVFTPQNDHMLWCGAPIEPLAREYQTEWYKGTVVSDDLLWRIDVSNQTADALINFTIDTGRTVDIDRITIDPSGRHLLLRNKLDGALWIYDTAFAQ